MAEQRARPSCSLGSLGISYLRDRPQLCKWHAILSSTLRNSGGEAESPEEPVQQLGRNFRGFTGLPQHGLAGLRSLTGSGRPPFLGAAQMEELREIVFTGPDAERHAVVRWRCADLCEEVAARWSVRVCAPTMGKWLGQYGLRSCFWLFRLHSGSGSKSCAPTVEHSLHSGEIWPRQSAGAGKVQKSLSTATSNRAIAPKG